MVCGTGFSTGIMFCFGVAPTMIGVGVASGTNRTRAGVGFAFGVLSVTTSFTGVAVGSGDCPKAAVEAKSAIKQKTTLVIAGKVEEIVLRAKIYRCERPASLRFAQS